jgi:hypothetical protein
MPHVANFLKRYPKGTVADFAKYLRVIESINSL